MLQSAVGVRSCVADYSRGLEAMLQSDICVRSYVADFSRG